MALELLGISAGYGSKTVVSDVSFALEPGQILAFLGHNGAGKTTTLRTVMGLLPARAGTVTFDGRRIERSNVSARVAMGLRLLPEGRGIFPDLDVAENIDVVAARNCGAHAMFSPADVYRLFPALGERRTLRSGSLSGGQQQMLALGLAILGTPRCLLLDEPSIGLAPNLVERMFVQVREVCKSHAMTAGPGGAERRRGDADRRSRADHEQWANRVRWIAGRGARVKFLALFLTRVATRARVIAWGVIVVSGESSRGDQRREAGALSPLARDQSEAADSGAASCCGRYDARVWPPPGHRAWQDVRVRQPIGGGVDLRSFRVCGQIRTFARN